jgi:hypothetical protein
MTEEMQQPQVGARALFPKIIQSLRVNFPQLTAQW